MFHFVIAILLVTIFARPPAVQNNLLGRLRFPILVVHCAVSPERVQFFQTSTSKLNYLPCWTLVNIAYSTRFEDVWCDSRQSLQWQEIPVMGLAWFTFWSIRSFHSVVPAKEHLRLKAGCDSTREWSLVCLDSRTFHSVHHSFWDRNIFRSINTSYPSVKLHEIFFTSW